MADAIPTLVTRTNREGVHPMTEVTAGPFAGLLVFDFSMYISAFQVRGSTP